MALNAYDIIDRVQLLASFTELSTGLVFDPESLKVKVRDPDGMEFSYVYGIDAAVERLSEGEYRFVLAAGHPGVYVYRWEATDTSSNNRAGAQEAQFRVKRSPFTGAMTGVDMPSGGDVIDGGSP